MSGGAAAKVEKEEKVQKSKRGDWKQNRIVMMLTKTCFVLSFFHVTLKPPASNYPLKRCEFQTAAGWQWAGG